MDACAAKAEREQQGKDQVDGTQASGRAEKWRVWWLMKDYEAMRGPQEQGKLDRGGTDQAVGHLG